MGAAEALRMYDTLRVYDAVTPDLVRRYVVRALTSGPDMVEGMPEYDSFDRQMVRDIRRYQDRLNSGGQVSYGDTRISRQTSNCLASTLAKAAGDESEWKNIDWRGYPRGVIDETVGLFGEEGARYLGMETTPLGIYLDRMAVNANLTDDYTVKENLRIQRELQEQERLDRLGYDPSNPFDIPFPDLTESERFEPYNPFDEPFPSLIPDGPNPFDEPFPWAFRNYPDAPRPERMQ